MQRESSLGSKVTASCGEGLSHTANVGMEGSRPSKEFAPNPDFGLHDARVAPLHSPILREDHFVVMDRQLLCNLLFRGRSPLFNRNLL
jgi:hypothetical protein